MKFRKKPVVIDAVQWFPGIKVDGVIEIDPCSPDDPAYGGYVEKGEIETREGKHTVSYGDWIITGVKGEKYPCKPDIFEATYEPVKETDG